MARGVRALAAAALVASLPVIARAAAQPAGTGPIAIDLRDGDAATRARIDAAARETAALCSAWLGPLSAHITVRDRHASAGPGAAVRVDVPWRPAPHTMDVESQVAFGLARLWFPAAQADDDADLFNGAAWYLQSRAIARLFDLTFEHTAHSADALRLFGGFVPWTFPVLRFDGPAAGLGRDLLPGTGQAVAARSPAPRGLTPRAVRVAHALASLERLVGQPRIAGALRALARARVTAAPQAVGVLGDALGQDVSWLFDAALTAGPSIQYGIESVESEPCAGGDCRRVRVTVARQGPGVFPGRSPARIAGYQSGDALEVRVEFADGQSAAARWDGRDATRTFEFTGPAPLARAVLDPGAVVLLDDNFLDQARVVDGATNAPIAKWTARWLIWLQHAMLAYSGFV